MEDKTFLNWLVLRPSIILMSFENEDYTLRLARKTETTLSHTVRIVDFLLEQKILEVQPSSQKRRKVLRLTRKGYVLRHKIRLVQTLLDQKERKENYMGGS